MEDDLVDDEYFSYFDDLEFEQELDAYHESLEDAKNRLCESWAKDFDEFLLWGFSLPRTEKGT